MSRDNPEDIRTDDVLYRPAVAGDLPEMADLFLSSVADMYARNNLQVAIPPRPAVIHAYEHILSTGDFLLAESQGRIIAIAGSVTRDSVWFLSAFWAKPELQRQKVGLPLLKHVWSAGERGGAEIFCTWSSIDLTAMACYMKQGMKPAYEILLFGGVPRPIPAAPSGYETAPLEKFDAMELDHIVRGTRREVDHELWACSPGVQGRLVLRRGKRVGYYYINRGSIGPAAWSEQEAAGAVLSFACVEAADASAEIRFAVPGINHFALDFALESGLRLTGFAHFLATRPFGCMERYLPSGPSLY